MTNNRKNKRWSAWLPLLLFIILLVVLWQGLHLNPRELPSTLINKPAPAFILANLFTPKKMVQQQVLQGHLTLLNVWASWCETCVQEQAFLFTLKTRYPQLQFIGLAFQDHSPKALAWLKNYGNPYDLVLLDEAGKVGVDYGVYGTPESFLIDDRGIIRAKVTGVLNEKTWAMQMSQYVTE
jgi:cytochrome c biogenesis protein CcmG/thiol:disulfide interchange protein DsbE